MGVPTGAACRWMKLLSPSCSLTCCGAKPSTRSATCNVGGNWWSVQLNLLCETVQSLSRTAGRKTPATRLSRWRLKLPDCWQPPTLAMLSERRKRRSEEHTSELQSHSDLV